MGKESGKKRKQKNIVFDKMETELKSKKPKGTPKKQSPRKRGRTRSKSKERQCTSTTTRARFMEDGNEILVELHCPPDSEFNGRDQDPDISFNNNATVARNVGNSPRGERRKLIVDEVYDSSAEEGKTSDSQEERFLRTKRTTSDRRRSFDDAVAMEMVTEVPKEVNKRMREKEKVSGDVNDTSNIDLDKISSADLIDRAVNKTYMKLTKFMEENGIVLGQKQQQLESRQGDKLEAKRRVDSREQGKDRNLQNREVNPPVREISETTIYETAIQPLNKDDKEIPRDTNRLSSSSEEAEGVDTSDETIDISEQINRNLNIIAAQQTSQQRDRFYDNEPITGTSGHVEQRAIPRQSHNRNGPVQRRRELSLESGKR